MPLFVPCPSVPRNYSQVPVYTEKYVYGTYTNQEILKPNSKQCTQDINNWSRTPDTQP